MSRAVSHIVPGAVESWDRIAVILGVLQELRDIVSGNNTNWYVAGGGHGGVCIDQTT